MTEDDDNKFMRRCLELAAGAEGMTYPNPLVGSVIVNEGRIIGEGYHLKAGGPHAEVNAIKSVIDKSLLKASTLYVNLEPCSHFGMTPPCADFIIENRIPRVVIGTSDTSDKVSGKGSEKLKKAGCEVTTGVLENECRRINKRFFTFIEKRRPYIILKWAESADGFVDQVRQADTGNEHAWISGKPERVLVHKWRASEQAILVGGETVRSDNPKLNVREWKGNNPLKIVLSLSGLFDKDSNVNETNGTLIVFTDNMKADIPGAIKVKLEKDKNASVQISDYLYQKGIQSLFIEGGTKVLNHFISTGLWDEVRIFRGKTSFYNGVKGPDFERRFLLGTEFAGSSLEVYYRDQFMFLRKIDN
jgi:diaminohydroxyphosphoribosylaminopyrimidine deaminase/5-amino-6-(5-phosphoribosylamino)uracil reductase